MKKIIFSSAALLAMIATGCSNDLEVSPAGESYLKVYGTINELRTRATDTGFDNGDAIGVNTDAGNDNVSYTYSGDSFAATGQNIKIAGQTSVTAYYPYNAAPVNNEISFDLASQSVDFLFAEAVTVSKENTTANFNFSHKMSKLQFTVIDKDEQYSNGETVSLKVSNVATTGKFNTLNGAVTADATLGTLGGDIAFDTPASLIVPSYATKQTAELDVTVEISNGDFYVAKIKPELAAGTQYSYTLTINADKPDLGVGGSINDWKKVEGGEIDMGKGSKPNELEVGDFLLNDGSVIDKDDSELDSKKSQIVGVVFYVGNPQASALNYTTDDSKDVLKRDYPNAKNGLAIAINNAQADAITFATKKYDFSNWFKTYSENDNYIGSNLAVTSESDKMLGYENTKLIKLANDEVTNEETGVETLLGLLDSYNSTYKVGGVASTWYVPSYAEFTLILNNYTTVNASIEKAGGSLPTFDGYDTTKTNNFYWSSDLRGGTYAWVTPLASATQNLYLDKTSSPNKGYFRFAIAF